jgi:hypothetical protein
LISGLLKITLTNTGLFFFANIKEGKGEERAGKGIHFKNIND